MTNTPSKGAAPAPSPVLLDEPQPDGPVEHPAAQLNGAEEGPVRLVIHYTSKLRPEVRVLGESLGATFIDVGYSDPAYFRSFEKLWATGRGWINVEQDILASNDLLKSIWGCKRELCAGYYWQGGHPIMPGETEPKPGGAHRVTHTLACVKFSTALLARLPSAMRDAGARTNGVKHYNMLDLALINPSGVLAQGGAEVHVHEPAVQHLHSTPWPS